MSGQDISNWTKVLDPATVLHCHSQSHTANMLTIWSVFPKSQLISVLKTIQWKIFYMFVLRMLRKQLLGNGQCSPDDKQSLLWSEYGPHISSAFELTTHNHTVLLNHSFKNCHLARRHKSPGPWPAHLLYVSIPCFHRIVKYQMHISHFCTKWPVKKNSNTHSIWSCYCLY